MAQNFHPEEDHLPVQLSFPCPGRMRREVDSGSLRNKPRSPSMREILGISLFRRTGTGWSRHMGNIGILPVIVSPIQVVTRPILFAALI